LWTQNVPDGLAATASSRSAPGRKCVPLHDQAAGTSTANVPDRSGPMLPAASTALTVNVCDPLDRFVSAWGDSQGV
jgi:hypothetical protein